MRVAALFPGQGSQHVGMGRDLAEAYPQAREAFEAVDAALGEPLARLAWEGPEERLRLTANTQPALLAHSAAAWRVLAAGGVRVEAVAGHSLGEYSAVVAAGGLPVEAAARLVRRRGELMQAAVPVGEGAMAAVLGLDAETVEAVCREVQERGDGVVVPANFNAPGQTVIAGEAGAVEAAVALARQRGARRAVPLPVSAPFHSPLMAPAREGLEPHLRAAPLGDLEVPLYRNVDAAPVRTAAEVLEGLVRQVDAPVRWTDTIRRMVAEGFDTFIEVGAGTVLSGLVRRIHREARCLPAGTAEEVEAVIGELGDG